MDGAWPSVLRSKICPPEDNVEPKSPESTVMGFKPEMPPLLHVLTASRTKDSKASPGT